MRKTFRTASGFILRSLLWLATCVFLLILLLQIGLACGAVWLGGQSGKAWLQHQVTVALVDSGYNVTYSDIAYTNTQGLTLYGLSVADQAGPILQADKIALQFGWVALLEKKLDLSVTGNTLSVDHLPQSQSSPDAVHPASISIPDIYFKSLHLNHLKIARLTLGEKVMGQAMTIAPDIEARISLDDKVSGKISFAIDQIDGIAISWLPRTGSWQGTFDPATMMMDITDAAVAAPGYAVTGKGTIGLNDNSPANMTLSIASDHLEELTGGFPGRLKADAKLSGTLDAPAIDAQGILSSPFLKQRDLDDITFKINAPDLNEKTTGHAVLSSSYKGKTVTLNSDVTFKDPLITFESLKGEAPDLTLAGDVTLDTTTMLATGKVDVVAGDLKTYADLAGVVMEGKGHLTLDLAAVDQAQGVNINAILDRVRYDTISVDHIDGKAALKNINNPWPYNIAVNVKGFSGDDVHFSAMTVNLKQKDESGAYRLSVNGQGSFRQAFKISGGADVGGLDQPHPDLSNIDLSLQSGGNTIGIRGAVDQEKIDIIATAQGFALRGLPVDIPEAAQNFILSGKITMAGPLSGPQAGADLHIKTGVVRKSIPPIDVAILADYKNGQVQATMKGAGRGIETLSGDVAMPMEFSLMPFAFNLPPSTPLNGNLALNGEAAGLIRAFLPAGYSVAGTVKTTAKLSGTMGRPAFDGTAGLHNGDIRVRSVGLHMTGMTLSAAFTQSLLTLKDFSAHDDAGGTITGKGQMGLGASPSGQLNFTFDNFQAMHNEMVDGLVSGNLALQGQGGKFVLRGNIDPEKSSITIPERLQNPIPQLNIVKSKEKESPSFVQSLALDINVKADNQIFVRGWGLDAEFGGEIAVQGTPDKIVMDGTLSSIRGRYEEFGRRFNLDHARLRFQGRVPPSPYLDIQASVAATDIQASVLITGPVRAPVLGFTSTPVLPQDEVLSRILFGKNMSKISPFQAIQLEQTLSRFSGKGSSGFDPLAKLRSATGLDDISVDSAASGGTTVGAGKYITDKVYLGVQRGQSEASSAATIKVDVTPNIAVDSKLGQDSQTGAGVSWHWDY